MAPTPPPVSVAPRELRIPQRRPTPRVADTAAEPPPETVAEAEEARPEVTETPTDTTTDQPVQEAAAPEEAQTQPEPDQVEAEQTAAPKTSSRPQRRPTPPARPAPQPAETQTANSTNAADTEAALREAMEAEAAAAAEAEAEAAAEAARQAAARQQSQSTGSGNAPRRGLTANGPPMSAGEIDGLRVAVERCWNVSALSTAAQRAVISVYVDIGPDKKPIATSIELAGVDADPAATRQAYEAARRAILRCGATGFPLPDGKEATWGQLELIFDKGRVGL